GLYEQAIDVTMITTGKLHDAISTSKSPGEPDCTHCRFGTGVDETNQFNRRHSLLNQFREFRFTLGWCSKTAAMLQGFSHASIYFGVGMAIDQRTPGTDVVQITMAIYINKEWPFTAGYGYWRAPNRAKSAGRTINTSRYDTASPCLGCRAMRSGNCGLIHGAL